MITRIEALNYRCLRYINQPLGEFHVLVGPNASGKTTFLDVIAFLGRFVSDGLDSALGERTQNFQDLVWGREGNRFELAAEARIPVHLQEALLKYTGQNYDTIRYEIAIQLESDSGQIVISAEKAFLKIPSTPADNASQRTLFPSPQAPVDTLLSPRKIKNARTVVNKVPGGNDNFYSEVSQTSSKGWMPAFKLGPRKSALGNLPEDESRFPVATWLKGLLSEGVQSLILNSLTLRKASPPGQGRGFKPDGSNLPWVIEGLRRRSPDRHRDWVGHLRTALPDLEEVRTIERPDDKQRYLVLCYRGGLEVPSWMASDGTLRLLALTIPAYLPDISGVYLIEEPENGIHPRAVETMYQSLSSVYNAQILLATHSPVILSQVEADKVLCFAKTPDGATDIVRGSEHPALRDWHGQPNLSVLFAGGVLG